MNRRKKILATSVALLAFAGSACGLRNTETNEIGLIYSGGAFEDKEFKGFLEPGATAKSVGVGSKVYRYRLDQRSYIGNGKNNGADAGPVQIVTKDNARMWVDYQLYFKLNRTGEGDKDKSIMRKFHENIGVKTQAWTSEGWIKMLRDYFEPQIERSMEAAGLKFDMKPLRSTEEARIGFQNETIQNVKQAIKDVIGDDYFCGPAYAGPGTPCTDFTFTVGKPEPVNPDIAKAAEAEIVNQANTAAQVQKNLETEEKLKAEREIVKIYGPEGALLREAIQSGKVTTFVVDPSDKATVSADKK